MCVVGAALVAVVLLVVMLAYFSMFFEDSIFLASRRGDVNDKRTMVIPMVMMATAMAMRIRR